MIGEIVEGARRIAGIVVKIILLIAGSAYI